jgi:hypothetical protein
MIILFIIIAVMMIASTSIGIQCLNDPKTKKEQYLIVTLILSICLVIAMGIVLYQNMVTPSNKI